MDTAWIQIFILTMSECVAPAGKTVCQEREYELEFASRGSCEVALQQLVALKERSDDIIVNTERTGCAPSARERQVFATLDEINAELSGNFGVEVAQPEAPVADFTQDAHRERLGVLSTCEDTGGEAPCKIGDIIIEGASEQSADVWRLNR